MASDSLSVGFVVDIPVTESFVVNEDQFRRYEQVMLDSKSQADGWKFVNRFGKSEWPVAVRCYDSSDILSGRSSSISSGSESAGSLESLQMDCESMIDFVRSIRMSYTKSSAGDAGRIVDLARLCCDSMTRRVVYYLCVLGLDDFIPSVECSPKMRKVVLEAKASIVSLQSWLISLSVDSESEGDLSSSDDDDDSSSGSEMSIV